MARLDPIEWRVWWLREEPVKGAILLSVMVMIPVFIFGAIPDTPSYAVVGFFVLLASFWDFLMPTVYRMTRDSIRWRTLVFSGSRPLQRVKRINEGPTGFWLSPSEKESFADDFRGFWLRMPRKDNDIRRQVQLRLQTLFEAADPS
jgi:hypothetical protein